MAISSSTAAAFRAIADPTRRAMLSRLLGGERDVGYIAEPFRMTAAAISQHLRTLLEADLVAAFAAMDANECTDCTWLPCSR